MGWGRRRRDLRVGTRDSALGTGNSGRGTGRSALRVACAVALCGALPWPVVVGAASVTSPADAIALVIAERLGAEVSVHVETVETRVTADTGLRAVPEPGARTGSAMRFVLMTGRTRRGVAVVNATIRGRYLRTTRTIARDQEIGPADFEKVDGPLPDVALVRLPAAHAVVGLRARRNLAPGELLTPAVLDVPPAVRAGDDVTVTASVGAVLVSARATASASGHIGELLRIVLPAGRPVRARVTGPGAVEVVQ